MPNVFYWNGCRFYFYSNENDEPIHIHAEKAEASSKFWLEPDVVEVYSYGFSAKQRKDIRKFIQENSEQIKKVWNEHFKNK